MLATERAELMLSVSISKCRPDRITERPAEINLLVGRGSAVQ